MIKVELLNYKSAQQELNVIAKIRFYHEDKPPPELFGKASLTGIENALKHDISDIKRTNVFSAELAYKVTRHCDILGQHLQIHHCTVTGDADRLIARIRDDEKPFNNWID